MLNSVAVSATLLFPSKNKTQKIMYVLSKKSVRQGRESVADIYIERDILKS